MLGFGLALIMCLGALLGLALVTPSVFKSWRAAPAYYNLARVGLPLITLTYFGPRLVGIDFPGREAWIIGLFLLALALIVVAIVVYLYREPGDTYRKTGATQPSSAPKPEVASIVVRTAQDSDLTGAGTIFAHAFHQNFDLDFGPDRQRNGRLLGELLAIKQPEVQVAVIPDTGQIVGAMWLDLADPCVPTVTVGRSWQIVRNYLGWLHAAYFSFFAMPSIMERRGTTQQAYLQWLGVDPNWQGQGVGRHLVEYGISLSRAASKQELVLHTERSNERARKLYQHLGFAESNRFRFSPRVKYVKAL